MLTPEQLRAARALLGRSRDDLSERVSKSFAKSTDQKNGKVSANAIKAIELGKTDPKYSTLHKLRRTLEDAGVIFIEPDNAGGSGVRLSKSQRGKR